MKTKNLKTNLLNSIELTVELEVVENVEKRLSDSFGGSDSGRSASSVHRRRRAEMNHFRENWFLEVVRYQSLNKR